MRLYYDCPIKALYMMKEFGVKLEQWIFVGPYGDSELVETNFQAVSLELPDWQDKFKEDNKFYVAKESESIFEPKEGDYGRDAELKGFRSDFYTWENEKGHFWSSTNGLAHEKGVGLEEKSDVIKIIIRDNKHFFQPLKEE